MLACRRLVSSFFARSNSTSTSSLFVFSLPLHHHQQIKIETGEIARQANGAVTLADGETIILATACASPPPLPSGGQASAQQGDGSFVPLQVNYSERFSAAGRTTGSFFKRDGRPKDSETLVSRLVDRPLRPNFEKGWSSETQVLLWVVSYDGVHSPEPLAITAAGAALAVSDIPLVKAVVGARVALLPVSFFFFELSRVAKTKKLPPQKKAHFSLPLLFIITIAITITIIRLTTTSPPRTGATATMATTAPREPGPPVGIGLSPTLLSVRPLFPLWTWSSQARAPP